MGPGDPKNPRTHFGMFKSLVFINIHKGVCYLCDAMEKVRFVKVYKGLGMTLGTF